tara:strand:+ start:118 stop:420 length:303 start_codon:yes stop_codon:yes gene_type:complete
LQSDTHQPEKSGIDRNKQQIYLIFSREVPMGFIIDFTCIEQATQVAHTLANKEGSIWFIVRDNNRSPDDENGNLAVMNQQTLKDLSGSEWDWTILLSVEG